VLEEAGVGDQAGNSNAVSPFISEHGAPRTSAWAFPGQLLCVWSSCNVRSL